MEALMPSPHISLMIDGRTFPLRSRVAGILKMLALHEAAINSSPTVRLTIDCSASNVEIAIQTKLGRQKVRR